MSSAVRLAFEIWIPRHFSQLITSFVRLSTADGRFRRLIRQPNSPRRCSNTPFLQLLSQPHRKRLDIPEWLLHFSLGNSNGYKWYWISPFDLSNGFANF